MNIIRPTSQKGFNDSDAMLEVLDAVDDDGTKSQRTLAKEMRIALGLTNAYLKRCIKKGWIKVSAAPARRYIYYLTPAGFSEKARLTAEYLSHSFNIFRVAREQCDTLIARCVALGYSKIVLIGASDLAEIASLSGLNSEIEIIAVLDSRSNRPTLAGLPVIHSLAEAGAIDAVIITDTSAPQHTYEAYLEEIGDDGRIFVPPMLRVNRDRNVSKSVEGRHA